MHIVKKLAFVFFLSAVLLTALYVGVLFGIPYIVDIDKYKNVVFKAVEKETGFKISCEKAEFVKSFRPYLKIHLHHTGVLYPDNSVFLQIKDADLRVKTLPLLLKKVEVRDAQLERPIINITLYKDFSTSIEKYLTNKNEVNTNGFVLNEIIPIINAQNYKIKFKDESINKIFYLEGKTLHLCDLKLHESAHIILKGSVFENKKEYIKYDLNILTALNNEKSHFTFSPFKSIKESNVKGNISGHLKNDKNNNIHGDLRIENLSLNIGNSVSKNNNADLIFKGKEVEISAVVHPSEKDSAKIIGKFGFGKKRFIDLNTNAKNINLENLFKIISATTKILNIENPLNDIRAKGILNADFNVKSDFKILKSKGNAEVLNASLTHKSLNYPISNINANINFDNNEINILKAQANVNKTPIKLEGIIKNDLNASLKAYSSDLDLKTVVSAFLLGKDLPLDIKKGILNFETEIKGNLGKDFKTTSNIYVKDLNFIEKSSKTPVSTKYCIVNFAADKYKYMGDVEIRNTDLIYNKNKIQVPKFNFSFDDKNINIPKNKILLINSIVMLDGKISDYNTSPVAKFNFEGGVIAEDIASIVSHFVKQPYKALGVLNIKGSIDYIKDKFKVKAQLKADKYNYISYLVIQELLNKPSITNVEVEADNNLITLNDISILDEKEALVKITGQIENKKEPVLKNVNFVIPNAVTIASNFLGGEEISLKTDLILNKNINKPDIKGNAKILKYNLKKYMTSVKNADVSLSPDNIRIIAPDVMVNDSLFNITADVVPDFKNITVSNMQINSMNLDLNSFFDILRKEQNLFAKSLISVKNGSATIGNFRMLDLKARDIASDFKLEKNVLKISNINANAYSGQVTGKADYELTTGILDVDMSGKNLNIKNSLYDLCKLDDNITGQTDVKAKISMLTGPNNTVLKTLSGSMDFNARNGSMGTLGKFEYYLYAQNLLYHGLVNTTLNRLVQTISHDDTTHFNFARGKVFFQNGYIVTDDIHTQGENMSLYIKGKHNMYTNKSALDIYGRLSDDISKKLGNFGDVSISDIVNGKPTEKEKVVMIVPDSIINEIEPLYNRTEQKSNTFKVNVLGNYKALNAINSFTWILPDKTSYSAKQQEHTEELPDFSDL